MRIAMLSSEVAPWVKSGGLGDVLGALPQALAARDLDIATFCPLHRAVRAATNRAGQLLEDTGILAAAPAGSGVVEGRWYAVRQPGHAPVYFLDAPAFFDRETLYSAYTAGSEEDELPPRVEPLAQQRHRQRSEALAHVPGDGDQPPVVAEIRRRHAVQQQLRRGGPADALEQGL